jgi:hypothetical protein
MILKFKINVESLAKKNNKLPFYFGFFHKLYFSICVAKRNFILFFIGFWIIKTFKEGRSLITMLIEQAEMVVAPIFLKPITLAERNP